MAIAFSVTLMTSCLMYWAMAYMIGGGRHRRRRLRLRPFDLIAICGVWELSVAGVIVTAPGLGDWSLAIGPGMLGVFMIAGWWLRRFGFLRHF